MAVQIEVVNINDIPKRTRKDGVRALGETNQGILDALLATPEGEVVKVEGLKFPAQTIKTLNGHVPEGTKVMHIGRTVEGEKVSFFFLAPKSDA